MRHKIVACYSTKSYSSCSEAYVSRTVMSARFHSPSLMIAANASIDYHQELLASLSRINLYNPPVQTCSTGWSFSGFYSGPTSIAYLFYRLSSIYPDLLFKHQTLLEWAEAYLQLSAHVRKSPPDPNHCGIANETLAYTALSAVLNDDASIVKQLCDYSNAMWKLFHYSLSDLLVRH